jgi:predicted nucleic acid-binding protein
VIYFDSANVLKCYLPEPNHQVVRQLLFQHQSAACCTFGRMEFASGLHRAIREGKLSSADAATVLGTMRQDEAFGLWAWLPLTPHIIQQVVQAFETLPMQIVLRTGDAIHLSCARENGFAEIYSNDARLLTAAPHFGLVARNVLPP